MIPDSYLANMQAVAVDELPWAHNPFKCDHAARFQEVRKGYPHDAEYDTIAGRQFFLGLHAEQFAACPYHARDWIAIADASIVLLGQLTPTSTFHDVLDAAATLLPEGPDRMQLWGLFFHPIKWFPGSEQVSNGQHRTCALRAAGAARCAVWTFRQAVGEKPSERWKWSGGTNTCPVNIDVSKPQSRRKEISQPAIAPGLILSSARLAWSHVNGLRSSEERSW